MKVEIIDHFKIREIPKAKSSTSNQFKFIINSFSHPLGSPAIKISNHLPIRTNKKGCSEVFIFLKLPFCSNCVSQKPWADYGIGLHCRFVFVGVKTGETSTKTGSRRTRGYFPNQSGKPTQRPTLRWIFKCLKRIY